MGNLQANASDKIYYPPPMNDSVPKRTPFFSSHFFEKVCKNPAEPSVSSISTPVHLSEPDTPFGHTVGSDNGVPAEILRNECQGRKKYNVYLCLSWPRFQFWVPRWRGEDRQNRLAV